MLPYTLQTLYMKAQKCSLTMFSIHVSGTLRLFHEASSKLAREETLTEQPFLAGFGGNLRPSYILPTAVATRHETSSDGSRKSDFITGPSRDERTPIYDVVHPVRRGTVTNWPEYEKLMFGCLYECAAVRSLLATLQQIGLQTLPGQRTLSCNPAGLQCRFLALPGCIPCEVALCTPLNDTETQEQYAWGAAGCKWTRGSTR